ncbi:M14 family metallopeptidase [Hydrogenophaga sp.]|uniref:M14 family metallopeptidase n=1 Tax=Hydrogenophaga sp. TaxID=1904254 RepID=UPI0035679093
MIGVQAAFSPSYARARVAFLEGAAAAGLAIRSHVHPLKGREGETLAMDLALDGRPDAERLLIISSACHGAEGYCGSGVQVFALHDQEWREHAHAAGVAVLYVHALNPHGFSFGRRVTHENVDLNRNFLDFQQALPSNPAYADIHSLLLPATWPPDDANRAEVGALIQARGLPYFQAVVSQGQYSHPDGLFFGGTEPTWSHETWREVLRTQAGKAARLGWIDVHTGLGETGVGERILACHDDAVALQRAQAWWGGDGRTPVTSIYDGSSTSAVLSGQMSNAVYQACPQAEYTGMALEFGTVPITEVLQALRADHWLHLHPEASDALRQQIQRQMRDAFYIDTDVWRAQVIAQARQAMFQAVLGLGA